VDELVIEEFGHLGKECVEKLIGLLDGGVDGGIEDPPAAFDLIGSGGARQLGVGGEPGAAVTREVELGDHADAALGGIIDDVADLGACVEIPIRCQLVQLGPGEALDPETLVVHQMPVEDVELDRGHPVEVAFDHRDRHEVAA
jgi:hypothetical protein